MENNSPCIAFLIVPKAVSQIKKSLDGFSGRENPSHVVAGGSFYQTEETTIELNGSSVSREVPARGTAACGCYEEGWDSDPASLTPVAAGASVVDSSSGLALFVCSYVEHSFLLH
jgi:hypothetical protein